MAADAEESDSCSDQSDDSLQGFVLEEIESEHSPPIPSFPALLVETVRLEDADSIATDDGQWLVVGLNGGEVVGDIGSTYDSDCENDVVEQTVFPKYFDDFSAQASATILWSDAFQLGSKYFTQHSDVRGDVTAEWAGALQEFAAVPSIFCLGRIVVSSQAALGGCVSGPALLRTVVLNNGDQAWPEATALRIVAGDAFGLDALPCGGLAPKCGAELLLDLMVPAIEPEAPTFGRRSAWVLTDGYGRPFGPVLTVEVVWEETIRMYQC